MSVKKCNNTIGKEKQFDFLDNGSAKICKKNQKICFELKIHENKNNDLSFKDQGQQQ